MVRLKTRLGTLFTVAALLSAACGGSSSSSGGTNNPRNPNGAGPAPVDLGSSSDLGAAGAYVILAKSAITNIPTSAVTGNIGLSPNTSAGITGFALSLPSGSAFSTSSQVTGSVYAPDYAAPTPVNLTSAISKMQSAYTDAAGRSPPDYTELHAGDLGGQTLVPGLYKWGTSVTIPTDVTISGGANDVWIFQIAGTLTMAAGKNVILAGGAQAKNIFWQVAGGVVIGATSDFEGIALTETAITLGNAASVNGRLYAQTAVTMDMNAVTQP